MAIHYDTENHNSYPDNVTLVNCQYVNVKEGCSGTIADTRFADIAENNTFTITNAEYIIIRSNNEGINISNSSYIIVGSDNRNVTVGQHPTGGGLEDITGAGSIRISRQVVGVDITGNCNRLDKVVFSAFDGLFDAVEDSNTLSLRKATGNTLIKAKTVTLDETNNTTVQTDNLELVKREPFVNYEKFGKITKYTKTIPTIELQSDSTGTVLDTVNNRLVNAVSKEQGKDEKYNYTLDNGQWVKVLK